MSETKFTEGSWGIHVCDSAMEPMIAKGEGGEPRFEFCSRKIGAGDKVIADVHMRRAFDGYSTGYPCVESMEEMLANAHLLAAAPDLYRALEGMIEQAVGCWQNHYGHEQDPGDLPTPEHIEKARTALAKARGEA